MADAAPDVPASGPSLYLQAYGCHEALAARRARRGKHVRRHLGDRAGCTTAGC